MRCRSIHRPVYGTSGFSSTAPAPPLADSDEDDGSSDVGAHVPTSGQPLPVVVLPGEYVDVQPPVPHAPPASPESPRRIRCGLLLLPLIAAQNRRPQQWGPATADTFPCRQRSRGACA
jgi:hypothetical protein